MHWEDRRGSILCVFGPVSWFQMPDQVGGCGEEVVVIRGCGEESQRHWSHSCVKGISSHVSRAFHNSNRHDRHAPDCVIRMSGSGMTVGKGEPDCGIWKASSTQRHLSSCPEHRVRAHARRHNKKTQTSKRQPSRIEIRCMR